MKYAVLITLTLMGKLLFGQMVLHDPLTSRFFDSQKYSGIQGTPFLFKDWVKGKVGTPNGYYKDLELKYDAYEHTLFFNKDGAAYEFRDVIESFVLMPAADSATHQYFTKGINAEGLSSSKYVQVLAEGKINLYKFNSKLLSEINQVNQGVVKSFTNVTKFYAGKPGQLKQINLSKKEWLDLLQEDKELVEKMVKEHSLNYRKEEDVVKLIQFFNIQ